MQKIASLFSAVSREVLPPRFSPEDEERFRASLRRNLVYARTGIFFALALGFGFAPLYQDLVFHPDPAVAPLVTRIALLIIAPMCLAAAAVSALPVPRLLTQAVQSAAVMAALLSVVAFRRLALLGGMDYPAQMTGIVMIAVAFFGVFSFSRMALASIACTLAAIAVEFQYGTEATRPALQSYTLALMALIALLGSYNLEIVSRFSWWESSKLRRVREDLRVQSMTDELTGHYNRRGFTVQAGRALALARRLRQHCAVLFVDVDGLKGINDRHGHEAGDQAIIAVGEALRLSSRNSDVVARIGGDEFLVLAVDCNNVEGLRQRIGHQLREACAAGAVAFPVSASVGVTELDPAQDVEIEAIIAEADARMLDIKRERQAT